MTWEVRAETHEGKDVCLRRGFQTHDDAENHPIKLSKWRRVWVQETAVQAVSSPATLRLPWQVIQGASERFTYIEDADGSRIASLWGAFERRERVIRILVDAGLVA